MANDNSELQKGIQGWAIAGNFAMGVAGMTLIGWALQTYVWTTAAPWLLLGFAVAGLLGGGYRFVTDAMNASKDFKKK